MRVTEALLRKNNKKKNTAQDEDEEPTQSYKERSWERWSLNRQKSAFASPMDDGLNTRESVFDRQAVFRTDK